MGDVKELIERVEALGACRDVDCEIGVAIGRFQKHPPKYEQHVADYWRVDDDGTVSRPGIGSGQLVPRYTASLDAAMALVPEGWWHGYMSSDSGFEAHCFEPIPDSTLFRGVGATPALAIVAAALRARLTQEQPA